MGFDLDPVHQPRLRASSAGSHDHWQQEGLLTPHYESSVDLTATITTAPIVDADIEDGTMLHYGTAATDEWRVARVQMYTVPPATEGPSGRPKAFVSDYRHYKYYGFAGKGAKTSWAHNPKYNMIYQEEPVHYRVATLYSPNSSSSGSSDMAAATVLRAPVRGTMNGPLRPLTPAEKQLVREFRMHAYSYDGQPSLDERARKGGGTHTLTDASATGSWSAGAPGSALVTAKQLHQARRQGARQHLQHHHQTPMEPTLSWGMNNNMYSTMYKSPLQGPY